MAVSPRPNEIRAQLPRIPTPTPALEQAQRERKDYIAACQRLEQRSVLRGLIVLAIAALVFSMWRVGLGRVFIGRWWWP